MYLYEFCYSGPDPIPPCYIKDDPKWKISHGSPRYVAYATSGLYNNVELATNYPNQTRQAEGIFTSFTFKKCYKYRIEIRLRASHDMPDIEVYAANGLTEKINEKCNTAVPPTVSDKKLIGWDHASCNSIPYQMCTSYFPSQNSYWSPDKEYSQLWITPSLTLDTTSFFISKIIIYEEWAQYAPPSAPQNLRQTYATGTTISIAWDRSTAANGIKIARYNVYGNGIFWMSLTGTSCTIHGLKQCTKYTVGVEAVDECGNVSSRTSIIGETTEDLPLDTILQNTINLSSYPNKNCIIQAKNSITLMPGFSVKANDAQEYFHARISSGCGDILLSASPPDAENLYFAEDTTENSLSILPSPAEKELLIYPNPTDATITIEYLHFTGNEKMFLYDITGKPILHYKLLGIISHIDVSFFSSGIYFIKVITQDNVFVKKLIKI